MADAVVETINKTVQKCPHCGSIKEKEVESKLKTNWSEFMLLTLFTFGVSLFFVHWRKKTKELVAICSECNNTFIIEEI